MSRTIRPTVVLLALVFAAGSPSEAAIKRVAKRYNVIDFYGGYARPHGDYKRMGDLPFTDQSGYPIELSADEWLDDTYFFGFDYGRVYKAHLMYSLGFRFTKHRVMDVFESPPAKDIRYRQYDLEFNTNYMFNDLSKFFWSPYVGVGAQAGFTSFSIKGADNDESQLKFAFSLNLGVDFKIWAEPKGRSFVTLSSINNLNIVGSDDRPIYLNIGGGLRYYFRP